MYKQWIVVVLCLLIVAGLYMVQISKLPYSGNPNIATLDELSVDETASAWEPFYRVRATLLDGQSARFSIPDELRNLVGKELQLTGAAVFFGNGCTREGNSITVSRFYLLPSLGLAQACNIQPDIEMRWTIQVLLREPWVLHRDDMIDAMATIKGIFQIDTSKPYEGVFFLEDAVAHLVPADEPYE
jgi:hypothetical protein